MGYLDNDTIVVDAILTKHGRKLLSEGVAINPTHFALSDDGVDYSLWNTSSPSGSSGYDDYISKLPMIEAVPDDTVQMRYTLASLPQTTRYLPTVSLAKSDNTQNKWTLTNSSTTDTVILEPLMENYGNAKSQRYDFLFMETGHLEFVNHDGHMSHPGGTYGAPLEREQPYPIKISNATFVEVMDTIVTKVTMTKVLIMHTDTGTLTTAIIQVDPAAT